MRAIGYILINGLTVYLAAYILPGVAINSILTAFIVGLILGVINTFIKPILVFLTLPITLITLGLFVFVINGVLVLITSRIVPGFIVDTFWWAIIFSIVLALISSFLQHIVKDK